MKICYFHGQYKANSLGTNEISYNISDLRQLSKVAAHIQKKKNAHIQRKWKSIKKRGCKAVFRTKPNIYDTAFLRKQND